MRVPTRIHRLVALSVLAGAPSLAIAGDAPAEAVDFARDIQPLFARHCQECHGAQRQEGGLRLTARTAALAGGDSGKKSIVPGDAKASRLLAVINGSDAELRMPPEGEGEPLTPEQIATVERWISQGAPWPESAGAGPAGPTHWAWQKPSRPPIPTVKHAAWARGPLDAFVVARIEQSGFAPAPEAPRHTLVRRVYLDLIGLPPTPAQVEAFVNDPAPDAYERMVDRALADPAYGERWARVWLDLARYADSKGYGSDPLRTIWRYRDWVIDAFNRNLPFDQFTVEQLAGDLLPGATDEQLLATAFHRNTMANDEGGTDDEEFRVAAVKDRIETTMQVWMGLTMGCAKCHSHKFDPITQREYYQAYAFFNQTEDADRGDEAPKAVTPTRDQQRQLADLRRQIAGRRQQLATLPAGIDAEVAAWEVTQSATASQWRTVELLAVSASNEVRLEPQADQSVRAQPGQAKRATYHITGLLRSAGTTAIRLEALADPQLPGGGPGLAGGNFVLNELRLTARPVVPGPLAIRYIRLELPGQKRILALAEVQAFDGPVNLAPRGQATQSSNFGGAEARRAIDGRTDGDYDNQSVSHTAEQDNPWWELDLGQLTEVERVAIWNRTDHQLQSRLDGLRVVLLDEQRKPLWQRALAKAPETSQTLSVAEGSDVELVDASADFAQEGWPAANAIDGNAGAGSGWAIGPEPGKTHEAVFRIKAPTILARPALLDIDLVQSHGDGHLLGRFRLSATAATNPPRALPQAVRDVLAVAPGERNAEQRDALRHYYWQQSPGSRTIRDELAQLERQAEALERQFPQTPIMRELPTDKLRVTHTMIKGNFQAPGEVVQPALPAAFHPLPAGAPVNRLGLARWLVDRDNPLTARVMVNRLWAQLFGAGLVVTEEDFGTQGLPPTHPQLLDLLAVEFMDSGWDIKHLLRQLVTSATYRQSSNAESKLLHADPHNQLLARGPRVRLEAEMVRDQALTIAGLLSRKQGGPSVYPPQPNGLWRAAFNGERTWATSTGQDRYRRGLYTYWRRSVPYPSMAVFDAPSREICTLRRISTNTPLQAFVTLNDPVFVEAAQALARRILAEGGGQTADRCAFVLQLALARPANAAQIDQLTALYEQALASYRQDAAAAASMAGDSLGPLPASHDAAEVAAWTVVSNVVLNLDGVLTKR